MEENLRYDGPVQTLFRVTTEDVEVGGTPIKARTPVYVVTGAANRDPAVFKDPDTFDITRDPNDHLGLGEGIHFCIGAAPARVQGKVAVQMLLERFPRLRIARGMETAIRGPGFRPRTGQPAAASGLIRPRAVAGHLRTCARSAGEKTGTGRAQHAGMQNAAESAVLHSGGRMRSPALIASSVLRASLTR